MRIRCGRCGATFEVPGPGDHSCPACGTRNRVAMSGAAPGAGPEGPGQAPPPLANTHQRLRCPECAFSFVVGDVETAVCPNCRASVPVGSGAGVSDE